MILHAKSLNSQSLVPLVLQRFGMSLEMFIKLRAFAVLWYPCVTGFPHIPFQGVNQRCERHLAQLLCFVWFVTDSTYAATKGCILGVVGDH